MNKINKAVKKEDLIAYGDLFAGYSKKRQQEILKRARYLKAAMELKKNLKQNFTSYFSILINN